MHRSIDILFVKRFVCVIETCKIIVRKTKPWVVYRTTKYQN